MTAPQLLNVQARRDDQRALYEWLRDRLYSPD